MTLHLKPHELVAILRNSPVNESLATITGTPLIVVDLTAPGSTVANSPAIPAHHVEMAGEALHALPTVIVGVVSGHGTLVPPHFARLGKFMDTVVAAEDLASIETMVEQFPLASTALVLLLRDAERRSIVEGLIAESATYSVLQAGPEFVRWRAGRAPRHSAPSPQPRVRVRDIDGSVFVTLIRNERHNAFDAQTRDELAAALEQLAAPTGEASGSIILDAEGPSFCSGGDLDEFGTRPDPATAHLIRLTRSPAHLIALLGPRTTARLHGACMGAGIELAAFAARVEAATNTAIALPELGLGLVPGSGGTVSMPRRIGRQRTALLALTGMQLDAPTALEWGLVDAIVEADGITAARGD